ncbi:hypothetical protein D4R78_03065 [bacterium]|nr:MAG: hypothetical protein D4R78_03065 [bacterium]
MLILVFLISALALFLLIQIISKYLIPWLADYYYRFQNKRSQKFAEQLEESFIFWEKKRVLFLCSTPFVFAGVGFLLLQHIAGLIIGFLLGLFFPNLMIKIAYQNRLRRLQGQLVDSLNILVSSLRAGLSFIQAIEVLCEEMPPPTSQEFNLLLKENKLGVSLEESLRKLRKRIPIEEVNLLVTSLLISRESGGELTKVLTRLITTIRDNLKLKQKITTLTLQGRLQGGILTMLPFFFAYFVYKQNPDHFTIMLESQQGKMMLFAAVGAQLFGMYLIKRISSYKF